MEEDKKLSNKLDELLHEWAETSDVYSWVSPTPIASPGVTIDTSDWDIFTDKSYGVQPEEINSEIYTSHEQRKRHDKYPALQKAWEDYIHMYNITNGEPPNVD